MLATRLRAYRRSRQGIVAGAFGLDRLRPVAGLRLDHGLGRGLVTSSTVAEPACALALGTEYAWMSTQRSLPPVCVEAVGASKLPPCDGVSPDGSAASRSSG
jgi:hypothetical protein